MVGFRYEWSYLKELNLRTKSSRASIHMLLQQRIVKPCYVNIVKNSSILETKFGEDHLGKQEQLHVEMGK